MLRYGGVNTMGSVSACIRDGRSNFISVYRPCADLCSVPLNPRRERSTEICASVHAQCMQHCAWPSLLKGGTISLPSKLSAQECYAWRQRTNWVIPQSRGAQVETTARAWSSSGLSGRSSKLAAEAYMELPATCAVSSPSPVSFAKLGSGSSCCCPSDTCVARGR